MRHSDHPKKRHHERRSNEDQRSRATDDRRIQHLEDIEDRRSRATDNRRIQQLEDRLFELENMNKKLKLQLMAVQRLRSRSTKVII